MEQVKQMEAPVSRRVATLQRHLQLPDAACTSGGVSAEQTSASSQDVAYSVPLPEHLTPGGPWLVHRCGFDEAFKNMHAPAFGGEQTSEEFGWIP